MTIRNTWSPVLQAGVAISLIVGSAASLRLFWDHGSIVGWNDADVEVSSQRIAASPRACALTDVQWASLAIEPLRRHVFRPRLSVDGKVVIDEGLVTPVSAPYPGRVAHLMAKAGEKVEKDQILLTIETPEWIQAQGDLIAARARLDGARARLRMADSGPRADPAEERNAVLSAESALRAAIERLRLLGRTDTDIEAIGSQDMISPEMPIRAPSSGLVVQRNVGPGQYLSATTTEPAFVLAGLSALRLVLSVRDVDLPALRVGQPVAFRIASDQARTFEAKLTDVGNEVDRTTHRVPVHAVVDNADRALKPDMLVSATIYGEDASADALPVEALAYEGEDTRVWIAKEAVRRLELRGVTLGEMDGRLVQIRDGVRPDEKVVTRAYPLQTTAASIAHLCE